MPNIQGESAKKNHMPGFVSHLQTSKEERRPMIVTESFLDDGDTLGKDAQLLLSSGTDAEQAVEAAQVRVAGRGTEALQTTRNVEVYYADLVALPESFGHLSALRTPSSATLAGT